jgi:polysaccharide biosynthesis PFTS motif protein
MWTYEVEKKGARILCYFYSVSEQVTPPSGNVSQRYEWGAASWPCYMVWDSYQADVIRREIDQNVTIKIVGPIWFSSSRIALPRLPAKSAAVFDLQQHRPSTYLPINTYAEYRYTHPDLNQRFLYEVYEALSEVGYTMVFKRKRDIGNKIVKNYKRCLDELSYKDDVIVVNPDVAAVKVIQGCRIAISMPFTSTALYNCPGVTSIYYDPTGWVQKNDRAAHGILVISGKNELRNWLKSINDDL